MYCKNCGNKIEDKTIFCGNCGTKVKEEQENTVYITNNGVNNTNNVNSNGDIKNANILCIISLICTYGIGIISSFLSQFDSFKNINTILASIGGLFPIAGFVLVIVASVKYPNSKFAKVLLIVYIVLFVISLLLFIVTIMSCEYLLRGC